MRDRSEDLATSCDVRHKATWKQLVDSIIKLPPKPRIKEEKQKHLVVSREVDIREAEIKWQNPQKTETWH